MSSRTALAWSELGEALHHKQWGTVIRRLRPIYRRTLPNVSKKTCALLERGHFSRRLLTVDVAELPVTVAGIASAHEIFARPAPRDPEKLATLAETIAERLTVFMPVDVSCPYCQYDVGAYSVSTDGTLILLCGLDHPWPATSRMGEVSLVEEPWLGNLAELLPADVSTLERLGVVLDKREGAGQHAIADRRTQRDAAELPDVGLTEPRSD